MFLVLFAFSECLNRIKFSGFKKNDRIDKRLICNSTYFSERLNLKIVLLFNTTSSPSDFPEIWNGLMTDFTMLGPASFLLEPAS